MARYKCRKCKTNTGTYRVNHVPYVTAHGTRKVKLFGEWQNWCMPCYKELAKNESGRKK